MTRKKCLVRSAIKRGRACWTWQTQKWSGATKGGEESVTHDVSNIYTTAERVRRKLAGLGLLGAAGAIGGLVVLLGTVFILGLARNTQAHDCIEDCTVPFALEMDQDWPSDLAAVLPPEEAATSNTNAVASMLLNAKLITGPLPKQKLYPCHHPEVAWKGGCWLVYSLEGGTREKMTANCKTTRGYEPAPGWCEKKGGLVYSPVMLEQDKKAPPTSVDK